MKSISIISIAVSLFYSFSYAYEIDNFTQRYMPLEDSRQIMNKEVNRRFQIVVDDLNKKVTKKCIDERLHRAINDFTGGTVLGSLEVHADHAKQIQTHKAVKDHIYSKIDPKDKTFETPIMTAFGLNSSVNINGHYIGVDKFGHFFDQGRDLYSSFVSQKKGSNDEKIDIALTDAETIEDSIYGLSTTGIRSYADLVTGYAGFLFWSSLTEGANPYFTCSEGKWKQVRFFDWADYVDSGWDEAINCSKFATTSIAEAVKRQAQNLEAEYRSKGKKYRFVCPVSAIECQKLKKQYGRLAARMLGQECLNATPGDDDSPSDAFSGQRASGISGNDKKWGQEKQLGESTK